MRWLIVEDALRDQKGHWYEYIDTFRTELSALGDDVRILSDRAAEPWLVGKLNCAPVLPPSIWHRMGDGAGRMVRLARVPLHAMGTVRSVGAYLRNNPPADIIFVPTVLVHHLLAWRFLVYGRLSRTATRTLLFFPNAPIKRDEHTGRVHLTSDPTARLFRWLIRSLAPAVHAGRVILGAETEPMRAGLEEVTGVPFRYLPHPVRREFVSDPNATVGGNLLMAAYGAARHEKGSDVLQAAIASYLETRKDGAVAFAIQWLEDFRDSAGKLVTKDPRLLANDRVTFIGEYFRPGEYLRELRRTQVLLLPYRASSYALRVSRVVIEAMIHGIPVIVWDGTTLALQAKKYGAAVSCTSESSQDLMAAIRQVAQNYPSLRTLARDRARSAAEHFSVAHFRECLLGKGP